MIIALCVVMVLWVACPLVGLFIAAKLAGLIGNEKPSRGSREDEAERLFRELKVQRAEALRWKQRALRAGWMWNYIDSWRSRKR